MYKLIIPSSFSESQIRETEMGTSQDITILVLLLDAVDERT